MRTVESVNRLDGEVLMFRAETREDVITGLDEIAAQIDALNFAKSKLKDRAVELIKEEKVAI